jgi:hypothetical protein
MNNDGHLVDATFKSKTFFRQAVPCSTTDWTPLRYNKTRSDLLSASTNPVTASSSTILNEANKNKVSIPRLIREDELALTPSTAGSLQRSSRACEPCRQRKAKCTRDLPVCRGCDELQVSCYYADGKLVRAKRYLH